MIEIQKKADARPSTQRSPQVVGSRLAALVLAMGLAGVVALPAQATPRKTTSHPTHAAKPAATHASAPAAKASAPVAAASAASAPLAAASAAAPGAALASPMALQATGPATALGGPVPLKAGLAGAPLVAAAVPVAAATPNAGATPSPGAVARLFEPVTSVASKGGELLSQVRDGASGLVSSAMNFLGVPYRRGGNSADSGFDCSGFTRHVFENSVGLLLPHRADEQAKDPGLLKVDLKDLKPGDLVFFNTLRRTFSHVGIYLGDGKFIHSPRVGEVVRVEDMRIAYWARRFTGARRVPGLEGAGASPAAAAAALSSVTANVNGGTTGPVGAIVPVANGLPGASLMGGPAETPVSSHVATSVRPVAASASLPARPAVVAPRSVATPATPLAAPLLGER